MVASEDNKNVKTLTRRSLQEAADSLGLRSPFSDQPPAGQVPHKKSLAAVNWLTGSGYLIVASAVSLVVLIFVWTLLTDGNADSALFPATVVAAGTMFAAVIAQRVVLRRARHQELLRLEGLGYRHERHSSSRALKKFTLEQNAAALKIIQQKSDQANSSSPAPQLHWTAFAVCREYLDRVERELLTVHAGSPRLAALRVGLERVRLLEERHLLGWAAEESRLLMRAAAARTLAEEKLEPAHQALDVLNYALEIRPKETRLIESARAVCEFIAGVHVQAWIELAERAVFKMQLQEALDHYRDALFYLSRETINPVERELLATRITGEITNLQTRIKLNATDVN